jgi:AcrR family transcriptional regulator
MRYPKPMNQERQQRDALWPRAPNQRDRQKAETRQRLLRAATDVFLEVPPTTASLEEIAARAGVRRQTLLYHFGDRDGLMNEVLAYHLATFRSQMHEFRGELRAVLMSYLSAHRQPLVRLLRHLDAVAPETPDSPRAGSWYPIVAARVEQALTQSGIGAADAYKRAQVVALALLHMADRVAGDRATDDEIAEFVDNACDLALTPATHRQPQDMTTKHP